MSIKRCVLGNPNYPEHYCDNLRDLQYILYAQDTQSVQPKCHDQPTVNDTPLNAASYIKFSDYPKYHTLRVGSRIQQYCVADDTFDRFGDSTTNLLCV